MAVARNGGRWDVLADDGETESLTHIEFEPFPQTSAYAALEATVAGLIADIRVIVDDFSAMRTKVVELAEQLAGVNANETAERSEEHTSELQSLMRISYAVFCLKKKNNKQQRNHIITK